MVIIYFKTNSPRFFKLQDELKKMQVDELLPF